MNELVVFLHGIARTQRSMNRLEAAFRQAGYATLNIGYPSIRRDLTALAEFVHTQLQDVREEKVHFVGYSMGCLLIRAYLARFRPKNLGRVVMVAPPNNGSEVADFLKNFLPYRLIYGPAGQQLTTDQTALRKLLGNVDYELGIIAGNRPLDPVCSRIIGRENDGKVSVESTKLEGMKEHVIIHASHTFIPGNKETIALALGFIRAGSFNRRS